ncbi:MAG: metal-dependent transcriptional regulator [Thermoplasmata archaeon]|nr:metal-dependent transcriptional regulator [Thermoplasmata archaeon]
MATERSEDYLEAIDSIIGLKGYARVKDVSEILGVGPSSVTEMFQKLSEDGYINYEKYGGATLTSKGKKIAKNTRKKHQMLQDFLLILGVDDKIADMDACRVEHVLNPETLDRLTKFVEFVQIKEKEPRWLEHFNYYYETGRYVECTRDTSDECPVHGKKGNKSK